MATDKYTVEIVDSDGNSSRLVLPGFALDSTQEKLIKSVQALGKMNPKQAEAYEKLLAATNDAAKAGKSASEKQTDEFEKILNVTSDKQVKALKSFRENFADRVGSDMRDTFVAGGNILTAAIKTATVGLAAGAGLLYKTFMDTSEAFRSLAQQGLGGAGASGIDAQNAVANLTRLGMSAGEAASLLTSFGRASALLGTANFSKFVSGIASAGTFAADLGLTLEEAAEYAAEEIEIRQRNTMGRMQLDAFQTRAIRESIAQTQRFASVMGKSMKDINSETKSFLTDNADINLLMMEMTGKGQTAMLSQIKTLVDSGSAIGGDYNNVLQGLVNAAAKMHPMNDELMQSFGSLGVTGTRLRELTLEQHHAMRDGTFNAQEFSARFNSILTSMPEEDRVRFQALRSANTSVSQFVQMLANAGVTAMQSADKMAQSFDKTRAVNDPMVTAGANFENAMGQVTGAFTTVRNNLIGTLAPGINAFFKAFMDSGVSEADEKLIKEKMAAWDKENELKIDANEEEQRLYEEKREREVERLYNEKRGVTVLGTLNTALSDIASTLVKVFIGDVGPAGKNLGEIFRTQLIPWIEKTATEFQNYLKALEGDTIGEKLGTMLKDAFTNIVIPALITALKEGFKALFSHPEVILGLVAALSGLSLAKTLLTSAKTMIATKLGLTAATAAGTATAAGSTLAARAGTGLATRAAGLSVSGLMVGKDAFDVGAALYKGEDVKGEDVGGVIGGVLGGAIGLLGGPVGVAIGASLGNMAGNWIGSFFDDDEAEAASAEVAQQTKEELLQQQGLFAMALDPEHIKAVSVALMVLDKVSLTNISKGLTQFNPAMEGLFNNIQNVRTQFVDIVSNRLERLVKIITGLNDQGQRLPATSEYMSNLGEKITNMPMDAIVTLADAFTALTRALRGFGDLTTSNRFGRMWDDFVGKEDTTESVIKVLNNFAEKVDSEKLLQAAQATQAFNSAMAGLYNQPEIQRTNIARDAINPQTTTDSVASVVTHPGMSDTERQLATSINKLILNAERTNELLKQMRDQNA